MLTLLCITIISLLITLTQANPDTQVISSTTHRQLVLQPQLVSDTQREYNHPEPSTSSDHQMLSSLPEQQSSSTSDEASRKGLKCTKSFSTHPQTTILAPLNAAIMRLSRKPHQGLQTPESEAPFHELSPEAQIAREESNLSYLANWVSAYVITDTVEPEQFPSSAQSSLPLKTINGRSIQIICNDIQDDMTEMSKLSAQDATTSITQEIILMKTQCLDKQLENIFHQRASLAESTDILFTKSNDVYYASCANGAAIRTWASSTFTIVNTSAVIEYSFQNENSSYIPMSDTREVFPRLASEYD
ncbi:uncharacterized protein MELLADRAFT_102546 [Melampsora larici-populina 98AG31]|uniref:Secreted protein n=1 Tax=Melampsora larici-populina (strain 98AG31 / pathotype 3-4-7) TaxID=747676 RepID=F4R744_MELLP|nr:uncharacterized protein MELLADRAFT_102546 [Melampsora larici-populina 98AG31]EGG11578.1 hypothetical protein MELLADRAFT_102546 [Melampsora larici-populina 98AG31]